MDVFDPVSEVIWRDLGWREALEALEEAEDGTTSATSLVGIVDIRADLSMRMLRGIAAPEVVRASLADGTIVITDAVAGRYEIRLPASDPKLSAAPQGVWDLRVVFDRPGGVSEAEYVGIRDIRKGAGE